MSRDWLLYLDDLVASAEKIERLCNGRTLHDAQRHEAVFDALLFNLQVVGECVKRLPAAALARLPERERSAPARLRDLIAHRYFSLDPDIVWEVATQHVPRLLENAKALRESADDASDG